MIGETIAHYRIRQRCRAGGDDESTGELSVFAMIP
jgi:hypothetical protein